MLKAFRSSVSKLFTSFTLLILVSMMAAPSALLASVQAAPAKPADPYSFEDKYYNDRIKVKLTDSAAVSVSGDTFVAKNTDGNTKNRASNLNTNLRSKGQRGLRKSLAKTAPENEAVSRLQNSLDGYYTVEVQAQDDIQGLVQQIDQIEGVDAYLEPKPAPSPTLNNYTSLQKYLKASPEGIGATYAKTFPGGNGRTVRIIDLEYSWNGAHEDIKKAAFTMMKNGTPVDPFNDTNHGTAVMGQMFANDDTVGVTGASTGSMLTRINTYNAERGWDILGALQLAATKAVPGDVVLIEQQTWAPSSIGGFAPVEWDPAIYDAIKALTASGINVVQPAGNSGHDLANPAFGTSFPMGKPNSGSIIVGAGSACYAPYLSRLYFSNYGLRVDLQGHGECVTTTGYGTLEYGITANGHYTSTFSGTSSAAPIVASAVASLSAAYKTLNPGKVFTPAEIRYILKVTGTPQNVSAGMLTGNIGPLPNLNRALLVADKTAPSTPVLSGMLSSKKPKLTWTAATDNVGVIKYQVYRNGGTYAKHVTNLLTYTDTTAVAGKRYTYTVYAVDASGLKSPVSNIVSIVSQ